ncbi:uncharacterized protein LY89DRAFT_669730 [Mollisia scopiformis]|uniref:Fe2OG dioxygenase domain-containing protein n=1 Tax=Mollisia scopiformis TaxID=149040 RepID=A0A194X7N9_MOLSC|nr:uncharacterized protein LY89DRAFT_669730 [Mollisia scopiformis]KUJ16185.1 hypothetical protein LY89DRAFT_669730 [Mollisia scopiformis]
MGPTAEELPLRKIVLSSYAIAAIFIAASWSSYSYGISFSPWQAVLGSLRTPAFVCEPHQYTTEIVSIDPLLIYINNFVSASEAELLIAEGEPNLETSEVYRNGVKQPATSRTSRSGALPPSSAIVQCILSRSSAFMGTLLDLDGDFGTPQIVRYEKGEKFDTHHDWYDTPQRMKDGTSRWFNRVASFFVYLDGEGVQGGETWFPFIEARDGDGKWIRGEDGEGGGTKFVPRRGNALFWVNLHGNGTGDQRVVHAGLPLAEGRKTAMNIWPRKFYRRERGWWNF